MKQRTGRHGGLALALAVLLVCGSAVGAAAQETPQRGGILTTYMDADPAILDIQTGSELSVQLAVAGVYSGLLQFDPERPREIAPDLAQRYEVSPDRKAFTFHLRQGVKWQDGQPFTSADVKATFERVLKVSSPRCGSLMKPILQGVTATDASTVRFDLKFASAAFLPAVASAWCVVVPKHILDRDGDLKATKSIVGTGPFKLKRYEHDSVVEWERNPGYFDPRYPYLDGMRLYIVRGMPRMLSAIKAGRILLAQTYPPFTGTQAEEIRQALGEKVTLYTWPINNVAMVFFNTTKPPFDHKELRQAVNLAIDRQELFQKLFEGVGTPCAVLEREVYGDYALPEAELRTMPGCRQPKDQDLAEARRLVAKHYPNGLDIEVAVRSVGNYLDRTQLLLEQLRKVGIRGTIRTLESAAGISAFNKGDFTLIGTQDTGSYVQDPSSPFTALFTSKSGRNFGRWQDAQVDAWSDEALAEFDPARRREIYHKLQRYLLAEDTGGAVMGGIGGWFFIDKRVRNYHRSPTIFDNNTMMKVWLAQ